MKIFSMEITKPGQSGATLAGVLAGKASEAGVPTISFEAALSTASPASPKAAGESAAGSNSSKSATPFAAQDSKIVVEQKSTAGSSETRNHEAQAKTPQDKPMFGDYSGRRTAGRQAEKESGEKQTGGNTSHQGGEDTLVVGGVSSNQPLAIPASSKLAKVKSVGGSTPEALANQGRDALFGTNLKNSSRAGSAPAIKLPVGLGDSTKAASASPALTAMGAKELATPISVKNSGSGVSTGSRESPASVISKSISAKNGGANRSPAGVTQSLSPESKTSLSASDSFRYTADQPQEAVDVLRAVPGGKPVLHTTSGAVAAPALIVKGGSVGKSPGVEGLTGQTQKEVTSARTETAKNGSFSGSGKSGNTASSNTGKIIAGGSSTQQPGAGNGKKSIPATADVISENGNRSEKPVGIEGREQATRAASEGNAGTSESATSARSAGMRGTTSRASNVVAKSEVSVGGKSDPGGQTQDTPLTSRTGKQQVEGGPGATFGASGSRKVKNALETLPVVKRDATAPASTSPTPEGESLGDFVDQSEDIGESVPARNREELKAGKKLVDSKPAESTKARFAGVDENRGRDGRNAGIKVADGKPGEIAKAGTQENVANLTRDGKNAEVKAVTANPSDTTRIKNAVPAETRIVREATSGDKGVRSVSTEDAETSASNASKSKPSGVSGARSLAGEGVVGKPNSVSKISEVSARRQTGTEVLQKGVAQRPVDVVSETTEGNRAESGTAEKTRISQGSLKTSSRSEAASSNASEKTSANVGRKQGLTIGQNHAAKLEGKPSVNQTSEDEGSIEGAHSKAEPSTGRTIGSVGSTGKGVTVREVGTAASPTANNGRVNDEALAAKEQQVQRHQAEAGKTVSEMKSGQGNGFETRGSKASVGASPDSGAETKPLQVAKSEASSRFESGKESNSNSTGKKDGGSQSGRPKQGGTVDAQLPRDMARRASNEFYSQDSGKNIPEAAKNDSILGLSRRNAPVVEPSLGVKARASELTANSGAQILSSITANPTGRLVGMSESTGVLQSRLSDHILSAVESFHAQGSRDWIVRIRPDQNTELNLRLQLQNNQLVIQARLDSGRSDLIAPRWNELQQVLAARGVQLQPLESGSENTQGQSQTHNGSSQFSSNSPQQKESFEQQQRELEFLARGSFRSGQTSATAEASKEEAENSQDGWQTWA